jgi:hypothetical protein
VDSFASIIRLRRGKRFYSLQTVDQLSLSGMERRPKSNCNDYGILYVKKKVRKIMGNLADFRESLVVLRLQNPNSFMGDLHCAAGLEGDDVG